MTRPYHCPPCQAKHGAPVYCAPLRCLCGHKECPAHHSYVPLERHGPVTVRTTTNTTWDDRTHTTWIDNL